jgi:arginase
MFVLFNPETNGVGKPNNVDIGLRSIRQVLPSDVGTLPQLDVDPDFGFASQVKALPVIVKNAWTLLAVLERMRPDENQPLFNLGGDCGSELVPVAWLNKRFGRQLQVVWIDAHADLNTPTTSPSGAFHGMVLRSLCGDGPAMLAPLAPLPLRPKQITLGAVRSLDEEEKNFIDQEGIPMLSVDAINTVPVVVADALAPEIPVYVHVDYDALDGDAYSESTVPVSHGLRLESLVEALKILRRKRRVIGMSLTEFAPRRMESASKALQTILGDGFGLTLRQ